MDGLKRRLNESVQFRLSAALSVTILIVALLAGLFAFVSAYDEALDSAGPTLAMGMALQRNIGVDDIYASKFANYVRAVEDTLRRHTDEQMLAGELNWPKPPAD